MRRRPCSFLDQYSKLDGLLLLGICLPLLVVAFQTKLEAVTSVSSLAGWGLVDFLRLHISYYAFIALWAAAVFRRSNWQWGFRVVGILMIGTFVTADWFDSGTITSTGGIVPYDVLYYVALGVGTKFQAQAVVVVTFVLFPVLVIWVLWMKYRSTPQLTPDTQFRYLAGSMFVSLAVAASGPLAPTLELNLARPPYLYQLAHFMSAGGALPDLTATGDNSRPPFTISRETEELKNLVVIALESVGADVTGVYNGSNSDVTPFLNQLAEQSVVVDQAYAVVPHTSKALVAISCGQYPFYRFQIFESALGVEGDCLAKLLREQGYATAFFQSPTEFFENRRGLVDRLGFEEFLSGEDMPREGYEIANYFGYEDDVMLEPSKEWLKQRSEPFFAFYLTGTPHHPYWSPTRYGLDVFKHGAEMDDPQNMHLNAVHYVDYFVRNLIEQYKSIGLYEDTLFVIVGDHGETFGAHGRYQHNASLHQDTLRIPLMFHGGGLNAPDRIKDRVVSEVDILPTVTALLGFSSEGLSDGVPIFGDTRREVAFGSCWYDDWCATLVTERYKYIYNFQEKGEELYDLLEDPLELTNLASVKTEWVDSAREQLLAHYEDNLARYHRYYLTLDPDYWNDRFSTNSAPVPSGVPK